MTMLTFHVGQKDSELHCLMQEIRELLIKMDFISLQAQIWKAFYSLTWDLNDFLSLRDWDFSCPYSKCVEYVG